MEGHRKGYVKKCHAAKRINFYLLVETYTVFWEELELAKAGTPG